MKIVLRDHVDHLGERGEVVNVAAGYARNYLLPKGLAYLATPGNMKVLDQQRRVFEARDEREVSEARRLAEHLEGTTISVTKKAGESGTLYGSVTNSELAELLEKKGVVIDRRRIVLNEPIKSVGGHQVPVKVHRQVTATLKVQVLAEGASAEPLQNEASFGEEASSQSEADEPGGGEADE